MPRSDGAAPVDLAAALSDLDAFEPADPEAVRLDETDAALLARFADVMGRARALRGASPTMRAGHEAIAAVGLMLTPDDRVVAGATAGPLTLAHATHDGPAAAAGVHLPHAVGLAWALGRRPRADAASTPIVVATLEASAVNQLAATVAVQAACWAGVQEVPLPLLIVVDDDGWDGAVPSPPGWVRSIFDGRLGLEYLTVEGGDALGWLAAAAWAVDTVRLRRSPVVLHLSTVRLDPPATPTADADRAWAPARDSRPDDDQAAVRAVDPVVVAVRALVARGVWSAQHAREAVRAWASGVPAEPALEATAEAAAEAHVAAAVPVGPSEPSLLSMLSMPGGPPASVPAAPQTLRQAAFVGDLPERRGPLALRDAVRAALLDVALADDGLVLLGPDLTLGGTYGVSRGLAAALGPRRVVDALRDAGVLLGLASGVAAVGGVPVVELPDAAALAWAVPLLRTDPYRGMVVRVPVRAGDDLPALASLTDASAVPAVPAVSDAFGVPAVVVGCPAHPSDAPSMIRTAVASARTGRACVVLLEPVELYREADMVHPGDGAWTSPYPPPAWWGMAQVPVGRAAVWGPARPDGVTVATYGTGLQPALRCAAAMASEGIAVQVLDLRWLAPLPVTDVVREASVTSRLLVVDPWWGAGGPAESLPTAVLEAGFAGRWARLSRGSGGVDGPDVAAAVRRLVGLDR